MTRTMIAAVAACALLAIAGCNSQSNGNDSSGAAANSAGAKALDGTWKADLSTIQIDSKPDKLLLKDGRFSCPTCTPVLSVPADGAFHPVTGQPYADSISVKVDDARTVTRIDKKGGRVTSQQVYSVSPDGNTLTIDVTSSAVPNVKPVKGSVAETRDAPPPAGAHAISGAWKAEKIGNVSDEALTFTLALDGDTLHMSSPAGVSYDAKLDGSDTPIKGDIGGTTIAVTRVGAGGFRQTSKRGGQVLSVTVFKPRSDGRMTVSSENTRDGSTVKYLATKQP